MSAPSVLSLAHLNGRNGFRLAGNEPEGFSGTKVSSAGDVNGDGYADVVIGASDASPNGLSYAGSSYVVFGSASGFAADLPLSDLNGSNGFRLDGAVGRGYSGRSVSSAGDVNGDGIDDILIGAPESSQGGTGQVHVVFGTRDGFDAVMSLADLDGSNGFLLEAAEPGFGIGASVSVAGDMNGDGIDDLIIGGRGGYERTGHSYVVFGSSSAFPAAISLGDLDGIDGFRIDGETIGDFSGFPVSAAGDVNGDGFDDVIVAARHGGSAILQGESYVVFGNGAAFPSVFSLADVNGANGFRIGGTEGGPRSGFSVSAAGDVNGDGFDDVIVGAPSGNELGLHNAGTSYVLFGAADGFPAAVPLSYLDGENGFRLDGFFAFGGSGTAVSAAGDVNGDGVDDLIIGVPGSDYNGELLPGEAHVVFGSTSGFPASLSQGDLDGTNGFRMIGIDRDDYAGASVSSAGDVNGDGFDDLIVGAPWANRDTGESYVVFGSVDGFVQARVEGTGGDDWLSLPGAWQNGLSLLDGGAGTDMMSFAGLDAPVYVNLSTSRAASSASSAPFDLAMEGVENVTGTSHADIVVGGEYAEWIRGLGGNDTIYALGMAADRYDGGAGRDTLSYIFAESGISVSLIRGTGFAGEAQGDSLVGFEDVIGSFHDDIIWGDHGANKLRGGAGDDTLIGNGGDDYLLGGFGQDVVLYAGNQADYQIRQDGAATWVTDLAGGAGTDLIGQVEILRFADGDLML